MAGHYDAIYELEGWDRDGRTRPTGVVVIVCIREFITIKAVWVKWPAAWER